MDINEDWFIISYYSTNIRRFDFITCILVLYDCFMIPFKNSFGLDFISDPAKERVQYFELFITAVFVLDLLIGFRRG